jgi:hypothetical protein
MNLVTHSLPPQSPLEHLVLAELEALHNRENQLAQQYRGLKEAPTVEESELWACEVWQFQVQTDRLARMLEALGADYALPRQVKH